MKRDSETRNREARTSYHPLPTRLDLRLLAMPSVQQYGGVRPPRLHAAREDLKRLDSLLLEADVGCVGLSASWWVVGKEHASH